MNLLLFITFIIACFLVVTIAIILFHKDALFTIAIGAVIGANVYNIGSYPVQIGNFVFGLDGVVYTIFLFCLLVMFIDYGKPSMKIVLYTALFSIFFTALLSFFGTCLINQSWTSQIWSTLSYFFSIIATFVASIIMIKLYEFMKSKNVNELLSFGTCILIANLVNSIIYFGLTFLTAGSIGANFIYSLIGSAITKFLTTLLCTGLYFIYEKYWNTKKEK